MGAPRGEKCRDVLVEACYDLSLSWLALLLDILSLALLPLYLLLRLCDQCGSRLDLTEAFSVCGDSLQHRMVARGGDGNYN